MKSADYASSQYNPNHCRKTGLPVGPLLFGADLHKVEHDGMSPWRSTAKSAILQLLFIDFTGEYY